MIIKECEQRSLEWCNLHIGRISGTRFGQVLSNRKNRLIFELMDEVLSNKFELEEFINDEIQYGLDNEITALKMYEEREGIETYRVGAILSEENEIHMASPDALTKDFKIIQEVKCTMYGYTHLQRIFEGVDSTYIPQCINYFAVSPVVEQVHFISYCGFRPERPLHVIKLYRDMFSKEINTGLDRVKAIQEELKEKLEEYKF